MHTAYHNGCAATARGCNYRSVAAANADLENTAPDVPLVYGAHSPEAGDARYTRIENELQRLGAQRDAVAAQIHALLLGAAFDGRTLNVAQARALTRQGDRILGAAALLAA